MYGYRYRPDGLVFDLPGYARHAALDEVRRRRGLQTTNGNPATVELVERDNDGDEWRFVPLSDEDGADRD